MARVTVRPRAETDLADAYDWYHRQRPALGAEFLDEVEATFARIRQFPEAFPILYRGVRRGALRRFPYAIYFRLTDDDVEVLACAHVRRHPRTWKRRA